MTVTFARTLLARTLARAPNCGIHAFYLLGGAALLYFLHDKKRRDAEPPSGRRFIERRFMGFASVEYRGQLFMTPVDFVESVLEVQSRRRQRRRRLSDADVEEIRLSTPSRGGPTLFRSLRDAGIISYNEYVFLLTVLTKPRAAFRVCFQMFDVDASGGVDRDEFLVLERAFGRSSRLRRGQAADEDLVDDEDGLQRKQLVPTTLSVHLFGADGTGTVRYKRFEQFMVDLQREVLELEFAQFSHGLQTISVADFGRILLRYTHMGAEEQEERLQRLLRRRDKEQGITFAEFETFMLFLNNLSDFRVALNFYWDAESRAGVQEFRHAVRACTGLEFSPHLAETVLAVFGEEGGLSCRDFLEVVNARAIWGFAEAPRGWRGFRRCVGRTARRLRSKQVA